MRSLFCPMALAVLLVLVAVPARAQNDPCVDAVQAFVAANAGIQSNNIYALLNLERARGCILGPTDVSGIEERYQVLLDPTSSSVDKAVARTQVFELSLGEFAGRPSAACDDANQRSCMIGRHVRRIRELQDKLVSSATDPADPILSLDSWAANDANGAIRGSNINLDSFLTQECAGDVAGSMCREAIGLAGSFLRTTIAMDQLIVAYNLPTIEANAEFLSQRDREWDSYFNEISVQYPWELSINGHRFRRKNADQLGQFPRAPNDRWVIAHPSLGFERVDVPSSSESGTNAAVFVELVGYERWQWREGSPRNRWGASIVASYADIAGMDSVGYGVLLHLPFKNFAIGAVRRDGNSGSETGLILNIDLATFLKDRDDIDLKTFLARD